MFADIPLVTIATFIGVFAFIVMVGLLISRPSDAVKNRLLGASTSLDSPMPLSTAQAKAPRALPRVGRFLMPNDEGKLAKLKLRMQQAGLYRRHSTAVYLGVKFLLMVVPMVVGLLIAAAGVVTLPVGILVGVGAGLSGSVASSFWLARRTAERQVAIRRALPDALDVVVVCLEGGLSLPAAFERVSNELDEAHPLLAMEMAIVQREVHLGRSIGDALRQFADRFDVEEIRSLASVIIQAERFGVSIVQALRVHADALRVRRYQFAEAQAQKAPVKLIFPTVLCIFPALYIVLMGPAAVRFLDLLDKITNP
jgi:tight adherence protein C